MPFLFLQRRHFFPEFALDLWTNARTNSCEFDLFASLYGFNILVKSTAIHLLAELFQYFNDCGYGVECCLFYCETLVVRSEFAATAGRA